MARRAGIALAAVDRAACLGWAQYLHERGLHPSTRVGRLVAIRRYLEWLWERGILAQSGRDMVVPSDLPKKPDYLPRPLPPDADKVLQERLKADESPTALGLLLMRRTGLRLGELRRLERNCVREDHGGQGHLKVPLGKLHNERLVPLDKEALSAIAALRAQAPDDSPWLIAGARGRPIASATYAKALANAAAGIELSERLTSHRLRHTFATSLMSGGMGLPGIMKLLGHRDYRMTLRYTAITDETVGREYFEALSRLAERYELLRPESCAKEVAADPVALINDVIRWVAKHLRGGALDREAKLVARRLEAVRAEIESLKSRAPAIAE
jgi:integrase